MLGVLSIKTTMNNTNPNPSILNPHLESLYWITPNAHMWSGQCEVMRFRGTHGCCRGHHENPCRQSDYLPHKRTSRMETSRKAVLDVGFLAFQRLEPRRTKNRQGNHECHLSNCNGICFKLARIMNDPSNDNLNSSYNSNPCRHPTSTTSMTHGKRNHLSSRNALPFRSGRYANGPNC